MILSDRGRKFIEGFETCVLYVYDDARPPVSGKYREWQGEPVKGTLTIGYGHTNAAKHPLKVAQGLRITTEQADEILSVDLGECTGQVDSVLAGTKVTQGQYDALVSFTFNCGGEALRALTKPLRQMGDYQGVRDKLILDVITTIGGQRVLSNGLIRRRQGEQARWDDTDLQVPAEPVHHQADVHPGLGALPALREQKPRFDSTF
jgi:lysozyme